MLKECGRRRTTDDGGLPILFSISVSPKDKFLVDCFNGGRLSSLFFFFFFLFFFFLPLAAVVVEERF